ncbi:MAG: translocation/assembly module TamB domain-containing protein, partial [Rhodobacteraceae bacterium]|nr:translocation/assembly module TamB domain-containing protein [Paracoccaceae bacterium]
ISDADGVWLEVLDVELDWSRLALLRRRLQVDSLTAQSIRMPRGPLPMTEVEPVTEEEETPAEPFTFPELPVAVNVGELVVNTIEIGEDVFGYGLTARADGSAQIADGEGQAALTVERIDGPLGRFALSGDFVADTQTLGLNLTAEEDEGGLVATLGGLPGAPSVALTVDGRSPISNYVANISLETDGAPRLTGQVETALNGAPGEAPRTFAARLGGDITPLFLPEYQDFFGPAILLALRGQAEPDGALTLDAFALEAQSIALTGNAALAPGYLPETVSLSGRISDASDDPVLLPLSGPETFVSDVALDIGFVAADDAWTARFEVADLARDGVSVEGLLLDGSGIVRGLDPETPLEATATLDLTGQSVNLGDAALDDLIADELTGDLDVQWRQGAPLTIERLALDGGIYGVDASAVITDPGPALTASFEGQARADDLAAFSGIAGRDLGGAVQADVSGSFALADLFFDVVAGLRSQDLVVDQPQADAVLAGQATVDVVARRDASGIAVERAQVETLNASADLRGTIQEQGSAIDGDVRLDDVALVLPELSGPAVLTLDVTQGETDWQFDVEGRGAGAEIFAKGRVTDPLGATTGAADVDIRLADLAPYSVFAGRDLIGSIALAGSIEGDVPGRSGTADLGGTLDNISIGIAQVDALLAGQTRLAVKGAVSETEIMVETLSVDGQAIDLTGSAALTGPLSAANGTAELDFGLSDLALLDPRADGPISITANVSAEAGVWDYDIDATAPELELTSAGSVQDPLGEARIEGQIALDAGDLGQFAGLAGVPLAGSVAAQGTFAASEGGEVIDVDLQANGDSLSIGQADVDRLLAGPFAVDVDVARQAEEIEITTASLDFAQVDVTASGVISSTSGSLDIEADLANLGLFLPNLPGAASVSGTLQRDGANGFSVSADATGPDGIALNASGDLAADFSSVDITASGGAPLGLANRFIAPITGDGAISFDVAVNGPPSLEAVSGSVNVGNGTVVIPQVPMVLDGLSADVSLGGSQAVLNVQTALREGGRISVTGPIGLSPPFAGDIDVRLDGATLTDSALYRTSLTGDLSVNGPLTGGATIVGAINVGETLIRLDAASGGVAGLPPVDHTNLPPEVRQTLERAGLVTEEEEAPSGGTAIAYPLDVSVQAPLVEVRGLGVNANFSGGIEVGGTTANVVPVGEIGLSRGTLDLFGRRLILTDADITLAGSLEPFVNIVATNDRRSSSDAEAFAIISGPISDPEITFESNPQLPEDEILAQLLFGTSLDNISPLQAAQIASTVSGGGNLLGGVQSGLGLDDLSVSTDDRGETALTAGTYLTDTIYADVTSRSDGETEFRLNLDLTDSITLTGKSDNQGESGAGIFFRRDY